MGYVVGLNNNPVVNAGDALLHLGFDIMFVRLGEMGRNKCNVAGGNSIYLILLLWEQGLIGDLV